MRDPSLLKDRGFFQIQFPFRLGSKPSEILPLHKARFKNNFSMRFGDSCRRFSCAN
jgi:hypothetical protein